MLLVSKEAKLSGYAWTSFVCPPLTDLRTYAYLSYFIALIRPVNIYLGTWNMHRESMAPLEAFVWHITSKTRTVLAFALTSGANNSIDPPCDMPTFAVA